MYTMATSRSFTLISILLYGCLSAVLSSNVLWSFSLFNVGKLLSKETHFSWFSSFTFTMNHAHVILGSVLASSALLLEHEPWFTRLSPSTLTMGLLYSFTELWNLSLKDFLYQDRDVSGYDLALVVGSVASFWHGIKFTNAITKGFGLTFMIITSVMAYSKSFWGAVPKSVFFSVLSAGLWWIGSNAENIWKICG